MEFDSLYDDESTEEVMLLAAEDDPFEMFLSNLDEVDGALPDEEGGWHHVRIECRLPRVASANSWMVVLADCLFISTLWLYLIAPTISFDGLYYLCDYRVTPPPIGVPSILDDSRAKSLVLNVGYETDTDAPILERPLLFYAGEQFPIDESLPVIKREWRLYGDLGIAPESVFVVIRADHRCSHGAIADFIQLIYDAGFRNIRLRVKIDPNSMAH